MRLRVRVRVCVWANISEEVESIDLASEDFIMSLFVEKSPQNSPLGHYPREVWLDLNTKSYKLPFFAFHLILDMSVFVCV